MTDRSTTPFRIDQGIAIFGSSMYGAIYGFLYAALWPVLILMLCAHAIQVAIRSWRYVRAKRNGDMTRAEPFRLMIHNRALSVRAEWMWLVIGFVAVVSGIEISGVLT